MQENIESRKALFRKLIVLALPIMAGNLLQTLYNLVDTFYLGKLGREAISAPSISSFHMRIRDPAPVTSCCRG